MAPSKPTGVAAYQQRAWEDAYAGLSTANAEGDLDADDVERLAWSAVLTGRDAESLTAFEQLHRARLDEGEILPAARAAFWLALRMTSFGEFARASGWFERAKRLIAQAGGDCVEAGYLRLPLVFRFSGAGDHEAARAEAAEAAEVGERHGDADLRALGRNYEGRALIRQGRISEGLPLVDEAMLAVTSGELSPVVTGLIYCSGISTCQHSYELARAREWTTALSEWCEEQPQLKAFAGACLVHRSEILQLGGAWLEALEEARAASLRFSRPTDVDAGNAAYQQGELLRLRGQLAEAEQCYVRAAEHGRDPQPGRALLRLAEGRVDLATAAMRRVMAVAGQPLERARFLPAHVEILLAANEVVEAREAADELSAIARELESPMLAAIASHATGAVTLAEGDARGAIGPLRKGQETWQRLGAPYLSARIRVVLARAFQALGDQDGAELERHAAKKVFEDLGAALDLAGLEVAMNASAPTDPSARASDHGLSRRELEVLLLVAGGKTNKSIARDLCLSERTIDRHVSNIFTKLNVASRTAATAWAFQNGLVG